YASCTASSASASDPSMRYATAFRCGRCDWKNSASWSASVMASNSADVRADVLWTVSGGHHSDVRVRGNVTAVGGVLITITTNIIRATRPCTGHTGHANHNHISRP